ncbi:hypothetical protein ACFQX6_16485 [Streptosporangium lutulentum]
MAETRRQRPQPGARVAPESLADQQVQRPQRVEGTPHRAEQQRQRRQADPEQNVEDPRRGILGTVGAEDQTYAEVRRGDEPGDPPEPRPRRRGHRPPEDGGQRAAAAKVAAQPWFGPQGAERRERHQQCEDRADQRGLERYRQILLPPIP